MKNEDRMSTILAVAFCFFWWPGLPLILFILADWQHAMGVLMCLVIVLIAAFIVFAHFASELNN